METFSFLFGVVVLQLFFSITDKLSKAVQSKSICAFEATKYASVTLKCMEEERSEERFNCLWEDLMSKKTKFGVGEPVLPRKRRALTRLDKNSSNFYYDESPKDMYRMVYYEIVDKLKDEIKCQYSSPAFALYTNVELILRKAATGESITLEVLSEVFEHFGEDLQRDELTTELSMIKNAMNGVTYSIDTMKENIRKYQELFPQTSWLLQLLLVMPARSATSERSFSSLRHTKTYLRTTMRQDRLNHLMMLYIHKNRNVSITDAMKEFVLSNDEYLETFILVQNIQRFRRSTNHKAVPPLQPILHLGLDTIRSCCGVQQADPLEPMAFALMLHPVVEHIKVVVPGLALDARYIDDGTLVGSSGDLVAALHIIERDDPLVGLDLNRAKSLLFILEAADASLSPLPPDIPITCGGFTLLECPIGPPSYCEEVFRGRIAKLKSSLGALWDMGDSQLESTLLRSCLTLPKVSLILCTCPPSHICLAAKEFDHAMRDALEAILGGPMSD